MPRQGVQNTGLFQCRLVFCLFVCFCSCFCLETGFCCVALTVLELTLETGDQVSFGLRDPPASVSQMLGLEACIITARLQWLFVSIWELGILRSCTEVPSLSGWFAEPEMKDMIHPISVKAAVSARPLPPAPSSPHRALPLSLCASLYWFCFRLFYHIRSQPYPFFWWATASGVAIRTQCYTISHQDKDLQLFRGSPLTLKTKCKGFSKSQF